MSIPVFYVPRLLRASVPHALPAGVLFFPGASAPENNSVPEPEGESALVLATVRAALPLQAREAAAVLAEMQQTGEAQAGNGLLRQLAALRALEQESDSRDARPGEMADLERFALAREAPAAAPVTKDHAALKTETRGQGDRAAHRLLVDCQKILLLAREQEKRMLEMRNLEARCLRAEQALREALGEDGGQEALDEDAEREALLARAAQGLGEGGGPLPDAAPWRAILDAMLPFLPEEALLFTSDADMADDLREAGLLRPLSPERAERLTLWPPDVVAHLLSARAPAWRLVGRRHLPEDRPWLEREVEVLAACPAKDPVAGNGAGGADAQAKGKAGGQPDCRNAGRGK